MQIPAYKEEKLKLYSFAFKWFYGTRRMRVSVKCGVWGGGVGGGVVLGCGRGGRRKGVRDDRG